MRPASDQAALLVAHPRVFYLYPPFPALGPVREYLEDQPGAIENLASPSLFKIALLHGSQGSVDDHRVGRRSANHVLHALDETASEQGCSTWLADSYAILTPYSKPESLCEAYRLRQTRSRSDSLSRIAEERMQHPGVCHGGIDAAHSISVSVTESSSAVFSSTSGSDSCSFIGDRGITVEIACL